MISSKELYDIILQQHSNENGDKSEYALKLEAWSHRIEFLPVVYDLVKNYIDSTKHAHFAFNSMKKIVFTRGSLMTNAQILNHFQFLIDFLGNNIDRIVNRIPVLNSSSDSVAITMRFILEKEISPNEAIDKIHSFFESGGKLEVLALSIIESLIPVIKTPMAHIMSQDSFNFAQYFGQNYLQGFMESAFNELNNADNQIIAKSLLVIKECLAFSDTGATRMNRISYPNSFKPFFADLGFMKSIFKYSQNTDSIDIPAIAFDVLFLFLGSSDSMFNSSYEYNQFFETASMELNHSMEVIDSTSELVHSLSKVLKRFSSQIDSGSFCDSSCAADFLAASSSFTEAIFEKGTMNNCHYILSFWAEVSKWTSPSQSETLSQLIPRIIESYITVSKFRISSDPNWWYDMIPTIPEEDLISIWTISNRFLQQFCEFIGNEISNTLNQTLSSDRDSSTILILSFFVKLVTIRLSCKGQIGDSIGVNYEESELILLSSVLLIIEKTAEIIEPLTAEYGMYMILLETTISDFMSIYITTRVGKNPNQKSESNNELDFKKRLLDTYIQRILSDLALFSTVPECGKLLCKVLLVAEKLSNKEISNELMLNNSLMRVLIERSIVIDFDNLIPEDSKKTRTRLNYLYSRLLPSRKALQGFLLGFDERFAFIMRGNTSNEPAVFGLYRDLLGVAKGTAASTIPKFCLRFIKWFAENHIEDTITLIQANSKSHIVVSAICHVWISFYKLQENKKSGSESLLSPTSGFGIVLFRSSVFIVNALFANCVEDSEQVSILIKLVHYCLTTNSANFGVMKLYGDDSFERMLEFFFCILKSFSYQEIETGKNLVQRILPTIERVNTIFTSSILNDKEQLSLILQFLLQCLLKMKKETWDAAWKCMKPLLTHIVEKQEGKQFIELFRPHFVVILDALINSGENFIFRSCEILFYVAVLDFPFVETVFMKLLETYDTAFHNAVYGALQQLFADFTLPISDENINKRLHRYLKEMRKYPTNFSDEPYLAEFFK